ncbi:hypothetical protein OOU_Y34scaffold00405g4 [Pyricularia oryzae Y34]|uniref:Uncharacterized protein n=2 Tax=Pyricularia oryzae TaxID=318829 RepID=A0AA97PN98_PYRO3|nr:hypothetical protein OOU_Y34scaffold00405g4 [Pyricularia oryzae Y34]
MLRHFSLAFYKSRQGTNRHASNAAIRY